MVLATRWIENKHFLRVASEKLCTVFPVIGNPLSTSLSIRLLVYWLSQCDLLSYFIEYFNLSGP